MTTICKREVDRIDCASYKGIRFLSTHGLVYSEILTRILVEANMKYVYKGIIGFRADIQSVNQIFGM